MENIEIICEEDGDMTNEDITIEDNVNEDNVNEDNVNDEDTVSTESENYVSIFEKLTESDLEELESNIEDMLHHYLEENFINWSDPNFVETMVVDVTELLHQDFVHAGICEDDQESKEEIEDYIREYATIVCESEYIVPRSEEESQFNKTNVDKEIIKEKIEKLRNKPQPQQRTKEWYEFRHGLITASNIWKALSTESQQNSLIYEKCQPFVNGARFASCTTGSLHWGVKYEPLTLMLYKERKVLCNDNSVEDFGCIRHDTYEYIGASPDGIVTDETSPLYGRMIEIKNIVNREIDGIPLKAYWIQMQVQMETCDLDECDFVETQIKEYETADEFWQDQERKKGIVLMFMPTDENQVQVPLYKFIPLNVVLTKEETQKWIDTVTVEQCDYRLQETHYWYLEIFSCVTVRRNKRWFQSAVPIISQIWDTILKERENGHDHRAPKKRLKTSVIEKVIVNKLE